MRKFIRHPTDIPIRYEFVDVVAHKDHYLNDISEGGLSFRSCTYLEPGAEIKVSIPIRQPVFEEKGHVIWSRKRKDDDCWDVGVRFENKSSEFRLRMVEQVCHIEHYKREALAKEGRDLSGAEAANEWIRKNAEKFPR